MISAREALERLREGNRRFVSDVRSRDTLTSQMRRNDHHSRMFRLAGASRDRLRPRPGRPVCHPRCRKHRRFLSSRQCRVRRGAVRYPAGRGSGALPVRGGWRPWKNFSRPPITSRGICVRSSTAFGHPWNPTHSTSVDQRSSSRLVRCLRKEWCQDLLHVLALTLGAVWTPIAMLRNSLDTIKHMMAVATTILVGRHAALHIRHRATDGLPARPFRSGIGKVQATLVIRLRPSRWLAA